jgi:hypothetical protein
VNGFTFVVSAFSLRGAPGNPVVVSVSTVTVASIQFFIFALLFELTWAVHDVAIADDRCNNIVDLCNLAFYELRGRSEWLSKIEDASVA